MDPAAEAELRSRLDAFERKIAGAIASIEAVEVWADRVAALDHAVTSLAARVRWLENVVQTGE